MDLRASNPRWPVPDDVLANFLNPAASVDSGAGYRVRVATLDEFQHGREVWNALVLAMRFPIIFCSWEWVYTWWEQFGAGREPLLLFVYRDLQLKGILPLLRDRARVHRDGTIGRMTEYLGSREVYPDHLDIICAPEDVAACIQAITDYLTRHSSDWDVLRLSYLTEDSALKTRLPEYWSQPMKCREVSVAAYIPVQGGYDAYLAGLSSNERQKIRSRRRKLLDQQGIRYRAFEPGQCEPALGTLFALHERRAQQKDIASSFRGPAIEAFHRALFRRMPADWLWMRGLMHGEDTIGVFYGYWFGNRVFYYQLGYNPDWSAQSAGGVLLQETIREAFERGCSEYNFLQGGESFKSRWASQQRRLFHCDVFSTTWRARLSSVAQRARELARAGWRRLRPAR